MTQNTAHRLAPYRLGVRGLDGSVAVRTGWVQRHYDALEHPTNTERRTLDFAEMLDTWSSEHGQDGYTVPQVIAPMLRAFIGSLNLDLGRIDAGTCDTFARRIADRVGWSLDADSWARFEVRRDAETLATFDTYNAAWTYILQHQGQSVDHATKHEGWSIENVPS